jgi:pentapeptide MXKDX repeat protein
MSQGRLSVVGFTQMEIAMKKILIATALTLMCGSAFAQGTGPAAQQDNMTKPGMANGSMEKGSMSNGSMNKGTTTGMSNDGMKKDGMSGSSSMKKEGDMSKDGSSNADSMKKN